MKVTINAAQDKQEDIFKPGTLVEDEYGFVILVSDGKACGKDYFAGTVIRYNEGCSYDRTGEHCTAWKKSEFTLFSGSIILEQ